MLTKKEQKVLIELNKKANIVPDPLTEDDLEKITQIIDNAYDMAPSFLAESRKSWNAYTQSLESLAEANKKLLDEIYRLSRENYSLKNPQE